MNINKGYDPYKSYLKAVNNLLVFKGYKVKRSFAVKDIDDDTISVVWVKFRFPGHAGSTDDKLATSPYQRMIWARNTGKIVNFTLLVNEYFDEPKFNIMKDFLKENSITVKQYSMKEAEQWLVQHSSIEL